MVSKQHRKGKGKTENNPRGWSFVLLCSWGGGEVGEPMGFLGEVITTGFAIVLLPVLVTTSGYAMLYYYARLGRLGW